MNTLVKALMLLLIAPLLSSCYSYKNISRKEPITNELLSNLEPGRIYEFELMIGQKQYIDISCIEDETVIGLLYVRGAKGKLTKIDYSSTFESIEKYVVKISERKVDALKLSLVIAAVSPLMIGFTAVALGEL